MDRNVSELSGGELQRTAVAVTTLKDADLYLFDEPSSYNDVFQRMNVSKTISELTKKASVILVEHDLSFLDYLSDYIHILYGEAGVYGIVSSIQSARTGINELLEGYLQVENVRFRDQPVRFDIYSPIEDESETPVICSYDHFTKKFDNFELDVEPAEIKMGQVIGILGANALGKTTFLKVLSGLEPLTTGKIDSLSKVAYKPQYLSADTETDVGSVSPINQQERRHWIDPDTTDHAAKSEQTVRKTAEESERWRTSESRHCCYSPSRRADLRL